MAYNKGDFYHENKEQHLENVTLRDVSFGNAVELPNGSTIDNVELMTASEAPTTEKKAPGTLCMVTAPGSIGLYIQEGTANEPSWERVATGGEPQPPSFTDLIYNLPNTNWPLADAHELEIVNDGVNITGPIEFTGEYVNMDETILETHDVNLMLGRDGWFAVYTETSPTGNVPKLVYLTASGFRNFEENMSILCPDITFDPGIGYSEGWAYCDFNNRATVELLPCTNTYLWFKNSSGSGWDTYFDGELATLIEQVSQSTTDIISNATYIKSGTFKNCSALNTILLSMVQTIGDEALSGSSNMSSISIPTEWVPHLGTSAFYNTHDCPIYVNSNYIQQYLAEPSWANYSTRIMPLES